MVSWSLVWEHPTLRCHLSYAELSQELRRRDYPLFSKVAFRTGREQDYLQEVKEITDRMTDTALQFMKDQEWQFFMVVYREPDEMAHFFWHHMDPTHPQHPAVESTPFKDAIQNYYQRIDQVIGQLLETSGPDTNLIIMSDHGTGPFYKDVLLNEWLRQKGWLVTRGETKTGGFSRKVFASIGLTRSNVSATLRRMRLGRVERWLKDVLGDRIEILPASTQTEFPNAIDWTRTKAYSFGYHGQIYINLKGREPLGIVSPGEEYNRLCMEITHTLKTFVDLEDGKPIVDQVIFRVSRHFTVRHSMKHLIWS